MIGGNGSLFADYVRSTTQRAIGPGSSGVDKLLAPYRQAWQLLTGTTSAMAVSRAVAASRVGRVPEIVEDGVEGFLVESMDANGLTEKCLRLIQSPEMAQKMGQTARARVERDFSAESMAHRVAALYTESIKSGIGG